MRARRRNINGLKSPSLRDGHIPGAVNLNWLDSMDPDDHFRFKPKAELIRDAGAARRRRASKAWRSSPTARPTIARPTLL